MPFILFIIQKCILIIELKTSNQITKIFIMIQSLVFFRRTMSSKHKNHGQTQKHKNHHKNPHRKGKDKMKLKGKPKLTKYARIDQTAASLRAQYESYSSEAVTSFQDLPLSSETLAGLKAGGYSVPTQIQREHSVGSPG